jgi:hypothetical protein
MARDMSGSDDGDVVIVGMMAAPSMESVVPGMAMTATAFVVVATMNCFIQRGARAAHHDGDRGRDDGQVRLARPGPGHGHDRHSC